MEARLHWDEADKTSGGSVTRTVTYYPAAGAMRINSTLYYTLKDHLGSASVVTDASGTILGENRYYPYGETRLTTGTIFTDKLFTGQREMAGLGIYHYQARFYSPKLGRFLSPDTIIPGAANPQAYNRYSYVLGNPLKYIDPTGHSQCQTQEDCDDMGTTPMGVGSNQPKKPKGKNGNNGNGATVSDKAQRGDPLAMLELVVPTNLGWNVQGSGSFGLPAGFSAGIEVNSGLTWYGFSDQLILDLDFGITVGGGVIFTPPVPVYEASVTTGPSIGWFSSGPNGGDFTGSLNGTLAAEGAVTASISSPMNADLDEPFYVDPYYGEVPVTIYGGGGVGCCTAGVGGSASITPVSVDLSFLLPWHWFGDE